jgi:cytochrome P450 family 110
MIDALPGIQWLRSPYRFLDRRLDRGELTFRVKLPVLGRCLVTGEPELVGQIARDKMLIGGRGTQALRPVVGDHSLIVLEGDRHAEHRSVMLPLFFTADPARYDAMNRRWVDHELARLPRHLPFPAMDFVSRITLHAIVEMIFGDVPQAQHQRTVETLTQWLASFRNPTVLFLKALHLDLGRHSPWGRFLLNRSAVHEAVRERIASVRRQSMPCALDGMIRAQTASGRSLSDDEIVSEVITFLLFGHDTSAAAMGWVFNDLLRHEGTQDRARDEARGASGDPAEYPFIRSLIQESMRLSPVVVHLTRHAIGRTQVGPHPVAEGERVLPCMYLAHRNPAVFADAQRFVAERFMQPPPLAWRNAYFPFGLGQRLCAGMPLALRQMVVILARLLETSRFRLVAPGEVKAVRKMVLMVPAGGPLIRLE